MLKKALVLLLCMLTAAAQSIRKDYSEMRPEERTSYVAALESLNSDGKIASFVENHITYVQTAHLTDNFLPWHRGMMQYFEQELRTKNKYLTLCYYNWYQPAGLSRNDLLFSGNTGNTGLLGSATSFFPRASSDPDIVIDRRFNSSTYFVSSSESLESYNLNLGYNEFRTALEAGIHGTIHLWIGGQILRQRPIPSIQVGMSNVSISPWDPTFYFHHTMVDKVWHHWLDNVWGGSDYGSVDPSLTIIAGYPSINPRQYFNNKALKLWYAENGVVNLKQHSVTNQTLGITTGPEFYFYTEQINVAGSIANFFAVPRGQNATIETMKEIALLPGFIAEEGSTFGARALSSFPLNGATPGSRLEIKHIPSADSNRVSLSSKSLIVYPNPNDGIFKFKLISNEDIDQIQIIDSKAGLVDFLSVNQEISLAAPAGLYTLIVFTKQGNRYFAKISKF